MAVVRGDWRQRKAPGRQGTQREKVRVRRAGDGTTTEAGGPGGEGRRVPGAAGGADGAGGPGGDDGAAGRGGQRGGGRRSDREDGQDGNSGCPAAKPGAVVSAARRESRNGRARMTVRLSIADCGTQRVPGMADWRPGLRRRTSWPLSPNPQSSFR